MTGRQRHRVEVAGPGQKIGEFHRPVAGDARDRRLARQIARDEFVDHRFLEARFKIENIMRDSEAGRHPPRVVDILPGAARTLAAHGLAMVVELKGNADDVITRQFEKGGHHRGIHSPRHGADNANRTAIAGDADARPHPLQYGLGNAHRRLNGPRHPKSKPPRPPPVLK